MKDAEEIKKVEKELKQLENRLDNLSKKDLNRTIQGLKEGGATLEEWNRQLDRFKVEADEVASSLDYIAKSFKDSVNELQKQNKALADGKRTLNSLANDAQRVLAVRVGETDLNRKNLEQKVRELGTQRRILEAARDAAGAETAKGRELQSAIDNLGKYESATKEVLKTDRQIENSIGATASIFKGIEKTLGKFGLPAIGIEDAFNETRRLGQAAAHAGDKGFDPMTTFAAKLGQNIKESLSLTKLLELAALAVGKAMMFIDKTTGSIAKNLGISNKEARGLLSSFNDISGSSDNIFVNTTTLSAAFGELSKELGLAKFASDSILETQAKLTAQLGYSTEAATQLTKLSAVQGTDADGLLVNFLGQVEALNLQNDLQLSGKMLAEEALKTSKATLLSLRGQGQALAAAAFEAKKLGAELAQMEGIADSLLNIESSIAAEFEAEVILGKQLNLERARFFALTNNIAGLAREINAQGITANSFAKMTRIEQEAAAKAIGLSRDAMGEMLFEQEAITKLSGVEGADAKEKFNNLVKQVGLEEAKKRLGNEQLANQMASANIQERFTAAIQKLQTLFITLAEPLMPVVDVFIDILGFVGRIADKFSGIIKVVGGLFVITKSLVLLNKSLAAFSGLFVKNKMLANHQAAIQLGNELKLNAAQKTRLVLEQSILGNLILQGVEQTKLLASKIKTGAVTVKNFIVEKASLGVQKVRNLFQLKEIANQIRLNALKAVEFFRSIATTFADVVQSMSSLPVIGPILGVAIASGIVAGAIALFSKKGDDVYSPATAGSGYGDRMLLGPEGTISLNNKDTVIAGTKLFKGDDVISAPEGSVQMAPDIDYNKMALAIGNAVNDKQVTLSYTTFGQNTRPVFG